MTRIIVIADDFTGALDTSVQFSRQGMSTTAYSSWPQDGIPIHEAEVTAINANTRHLPPEQAYEKTAVIVRFALDQGIGCIYKKTDSALRGNLGSELEAVLNTSGQNALYFLPAYPKNNRTTVNGIHYLNGVEIAQTVFGRDPFEPVTESSVAAVIAQQSAVNTQVISFDGINKISAPENPSIYIIDASTDQDILTFCESLKKHPRDECQCLLLAGCAGLAQFVPMLLTEDSPMASPAPIQRSGKDPVFNRRLRALLLVSGSLNPITLEQISKARAEGVTCYSLSSSRELVPGFVTTQAGRGLAEDIRSDLRKRQKVIISTDGVLKGAGFARGTQRSSIAVALAQLTHAVLNGLEEYALAVFGGDTSAEVINQMFGGGVMPLKEIQPGVVLSTCKNSQGTPVQLITKSGGFGSPDVIKQITGFFSL